MANEERLYLSMLSLQSKNQVINLSAVLGSDLNLRSHIYSIANEPFTTSERIRDMVSKDDLERLVHASVSSRLDCCGRQYAAIRQLQLIQNAAAVVTRISETETVSISND